MKKRILPILLALIMVMSLMPTVAMADEEVNTFSALKSNLEAGKSVKLTGDIEQLDTAGCIHIGKDVTIDLNGHKIDVLGNGSCSLNGTDATHFIRVYGGATLTINDTSVDKDGSISSTYKANSALFVIDVVDGKVVLKNGTITNDSDVNRGAQLVYLRGSSKFEMNGGKVEAVKNPSVNQTVTPVYLNNKETTLTVNEGEITGGTIRSEGKIEVTGGTIYGDLSGFNVSFGGGYGIFNGTTTVVQTEKPAQYTAILVRNGASTCYNSTGAAEKLINSFKSGDIIETTESAVVDKTIAFNYSLTIKCVGENVSVTGLKAADGCVLSTTVNSDGSTTYTSITTQDVAVAATIDHDGNVTYWNILANAVVNANAGDTVKLLKNIDLGTSTQAITKDLTLDLNGFEITTNKADTSRYQYAPIYASGANTVTIIDSSVEQTGTIKNTAANGNALLTKSNDAAKIVVKGGNYFGNLKVVKGSIEVLGGTFDKNVTELLPNGMTQNESGKVVISNDAVASVNGVGYTTFDDAFEAAKDGGAITLLKDVTIDNKTYTFTEDTVITGTNVKMTVERTAAGVAFEIRNGAELTFQGIELEINGVVGSSAGGAVTKGIDVYDGELFFIDSKVYFNDLRSAIVMQKTESRANIVSSFVTASNVWGNFSNGGSWYIQSSDLDISGNKDSKGHGLSATELKIWKSSVNVNSCGLLGLTAKRLDVDNSTITVNECGTQLPYTSEWSTDNESYKYPVEIQNGGSVTIDKDSWVTLMNNQAGNVLYLVNSTLAADGRLDASIRTNSGSECYIVSIEGFNPMVVASGDTVTLPTVTKPGYIFMGWKCSDGHTYEANATVTITGNVTFTAVWANMPDITPGTPDDDDDDEPVVPEFPFTDVYVGQWFYEAVKYVYGEGIMNGMDRYTFEPNGTLTRAMVWTMLARMDGADTEGGATWYSKAQDWAMSLDVSDGTNPMGAITREELVTMLWRYAYACDADMSLGDDTNILSYVDIDKVSDWAVEAFQWCCGAGIIEGDDVGALNPTAGCTRAEAAAMFMRLCENVDLSPTM